MTYILYSNTIWICQHYWLSKSTWNVACIHCVIPTHTLEHSISHSILNTWWPCYICELIKWLPAYIHVCKYTLMYTYIYIHHLIIYITYNSFSYIHASWAVINLPTLPLASNRLPAWLCVCVWYTCECIYIYMYIYVLTRVYIRYHMHMMWYCV